MTIARWQRWALLLQLVGCAAFLSWALRLPWPQWIWAFALVWVWLRLPLTVQFLLAWRADAARPPWREWLRAWWFEGIWAARVFGWWQPWRAAALADVLTPPRAGQAGRGVVLVHGFVCNRGFWTPWLRRLRREGRAFVAVNLEPPLASIDAYASAIDVAVRQVAEATGTKPLVVAHSMGGLAVRAWMRAVPGADLRVHRVVTLATPHQGTGAARYAFSANGLQMRLGSAWLQALAAVEPPERRALFECWQTECDNVVYPLGSAVLPGAAVHSLPALGHVQLAFDPQVMRACWGWLEG